MKGKTKTKTKAVKSEKDISSYILTRNIVKKQEIAIPVQSFTNEAQVYCVSLSLNKHGDFSLNCNCGELYNDAARERCKHRKGILDLLNKQYSYSSTSSTTSSSDAKIKEVEITLEELLLD
jgi:hypothetical protein